MNQVATLVERRGKRHFTRIEITRRSSGEPISIGVHVVSGTRPGPRFTIFTTSHGDETWGVHLLRELLPRLDPQTLAGTVIAVPVANPVAFESGTRNAGQGLNTDSSNLNRVFPGNHVGWLTEQMAAAISDEIVANSDALIDIHCGTSESSVDYALLEGRGDPVHEQTYELARALGRRVIYWHDAGLYPGTITDYAVRLGIPSFMAEVGSAAQLQTAYTERVIGGFLNMMSRLGMVKTPSFTVGEQILVKNRLIVRTRNGGIFEPLVGLEAVGQDVPARTLLGRVYDAASFEVLEEIVAPYESNTLIQMRYSWGRVNPGDYAYIISDRSRADSVSA